MTIDDIQNYFRSQQASLQWSPVLRALAVELNAQSNPEALRQMFGRIGRHFAQDVADQFDNVQTLSGFAENLNDFLARINWGWVELREENGGIDIQHRCAPLADAFGIEELSWSVGLLEGFYETLFKQLGAEEAATVRGVGTGAEGLNVRLRLTT